LSLTCGQKYICFTGVPIMMKRLLTVALLVTMFVSVPMLAAKDWPAQDGYKTKVDALEGEAKDKAKSELAAAKAAWDDLHDAEEALKAEKNDENKKAVADAQAAFDAEVAKLDARFPSMLCKVESFVTWPARKAGELLQNKWGARVATAAGVAAIAYCVYTVVNDNADDEADDMRTWA
jgi:hypothetical protein